MTRPLRLSPWLAGFVVCAAVLGGCSSSKERSSLGPLNLQFTSTTAGNRHTSLAQFSAAEAVKLPEPTGADAEAIAALGRGAPPTPAEVVANIHGMDGTTEAHNPTPDPLPAPVRDDLEAAATAADLYPTAGDAADAGYRLASRTLAGIGAHWIKWSLVTAPFDAAAPSMLLYESDERSARLVGLSYYTQSASEPTAFADGGARWHRHIGLCIVHGVLVAEGMTATRACPQGRLLPGRNMWMLHAWVVPGYENRDGVFAPVNPALCTAKRPCSTPGK